MIVVVGDIVTDVLAVLDTELAYGSDTPASIRFTGGGQAANTAAWLASLGATVTLVGSVGDDQPGRDRLAELEAAGVLTSVDVHSGVGTGSVIVLAHGEERTMISDRGANLLLDTARLESAVAAGATHVHVSGYTLFDPACRASGLRALELGRAGGLTTSVDAASAAPLRLVASDFLIWVRGVDLLFANAMEASVLTSPGDPEHQAGDLARSTGGAVVLKLGSGGAVWADDAGGRREHGIPVPVVDATGAGDAFAAGVLDAWTRGADVASTLSAGCGLGAKAVRLIGARPL
ncbi:PfkB family carbohydrate kinase [Phytoactinopolyspora mesophila]|uniref:Ribokinase n=1 Tax=Phytoactinopolyspora mesophila TaxID=2650750 RepID=A0A7K3LZM6_9ACTN|nr:ribokinase [Phytoactinopolyspora mesophila]